MKVEIAKQLYETLAKKLHTYKVGPVAVPPWDELKSNERAAYIDVVMTLCESGVIATRIPRINAIAQDVSDMKPDVMRLGRIELVVGQ